MALGIAPDIDLEEIWVPVDETARLLARMAHLPDEGGRFALTTERPVHLRDVLQQARRHGRDIEVRTLADWLMALKARFPEEHGVLEPIFGSHAAPRGGTRHGPDSAAPNGYAPIVAAGIDEDTMARYLGALAAGRGAGGPDGGSVRRDESV
jgi:thioester reductase-like protein